MQKTVFAAAPILAGIAAASLITGSAFAAEAPALRVSYGDLNLSQQHDADIMLGRIRKASADVCAAVPGSTGTSYAAIEQFDACYKTTVKNAVAALNARKVTMAYNRSGQDTALASR